MSPRLVARAGAVCCLVALTACAGSSDAAKVGQAGSPRGADSALADFLVDSSVVDLPLELPSQLFVEHDAVVVARTPGAVDSLFVELGDRVAAGQTLATLERGDQEIALARAEAAFENLERVAIRARALSKAGGTTPADSEQVEFQLRQADLARRKARRDIELTRVSAPFDGAITQRITRPRRFVAMGDTLFRVSETAPLFARIRVPEANAASARIGDAATVVRANGERVIATVVQASPAIDAASGTRELVLRLAAPGSFVAGASVRVQLGRERRRVLSVPREAIAPEGYALVVEHGRTTVRPVVVGGDIGAGRIEIVSGLVRGERLARPAR